ncbi:hypothetical protein V8E55_005716 [Tylopilus felleus]
MHPLNKTGKKWPWTDRFIAYVQYFDIIAKDITQLPILKHAKQAFYGLYEKYSTVEATYKVIGSLPPREGHCVTMMDKFVSIGLQGKVINKRHDTAVHSRRLGFFLNLIFASFTKEFTNIGPKSLIAPLSSIPGVAHQSMSYSTLSRSESVELCDRENKRWRWNLPLLDAPIVTQPDSLVEPSNALNNQQSLSSKQQVALFFNWIATPSMASSTGYSHKSDLVLIDNNAFSHDEITWLSPKVIAEYTKETFQPASQISKTIDTKVYLILSNLPTFNIHSDAQHFLFIIVALIFGCWASIGFDLTVEIHPPSVNKQRHFAHEITLSAKAINDEQDPTKEPSIPDLAPVIRKICVNDVYYDIISIIFSNTGFVGRGTVCVYYVIKDHWVRDLDQEGGIHDPEMIHEARMVELVKDINGVPTLHKAWVVKVKKGVSDSTALYHEEKYRGKMPSQSTHV